MYWLRDAADTLDVLLTYGSADEPVFARTVADYRALARDCGQADEFERLLQRLLALKSGPSPETPLAVR